MLPQIFVVSSRKIQARGYETLYQFATANERSLFGRVVLRAPMRLRVNICCCCSCTQTSGLPVHIWYLVLQNHSHRTCAVNAAAGVHGDAYGPRDAHLPAGAPILGVLLGGALLRLLLLHRCPNSTSSVPNV
jgi:hypothetical protein